MSGSRLIIDLEHVVPNHQLVVATAVDVVWVYGRKDVVRDITTHVVRVISPGNVRWHAFDLADNFTLVQDLSSVRITLDIVLAAGPSPLSAPFDTGSRGSIEVGAL